MDDSCLRRTAVGVARRTTHAKMSLTSVNTANVTRDAERISRYNDLDHFAELFDLDVAAKALHEDVETAGTLEQFRDVEATPEHRRGFALALLKYRREASAAGRE